MAQCSIKTATLVGVQALPVDAEIDVGAGLPTFAIVGLGDLAVQEARERVRSALRAAGFDLPNARVVVNLAPGPLRKHGTGFDLPIALGILTATRQIPAEYTRDAMAVGELSLDGSVKSVPGLLAYGMTARDEGLSLIGPSHSGDIAVLDGLSYRGLRGLDAVRLGSECATSATPRPRHPLRHEVDFEDVAGHEMAKRALLIAGAGGHNVLFIGPPGSGKTMLARRLPTILPPLDDAERLQSALLHSVAGLDESAAAAGVRPFRAPHHSASIAGLVGGGTPPRPGEASLAHNGVLFLDEMPEFGPAALQALRQPLEDGSITLVRAEGRLAFPARFALVGAANPCPCGFHGDPQRRCGCPPAVVERYQARIGGPLMDRIDIVVDVGRVDPAVVIDAPAGTSSADLLARVLEARERSGRRRLGSTATLTGSTLLEACSMGQEARATLESAARRQHLSGRGITRLLRVARTVADLDGADRVRTEHVIEALGFRARQG